LENETGTGISVPSPSQKCRPCGKGKVERGHLENQGHEKRALALIIIMPGIDSNEISAYDTMSVKY
jgi:hypothetical protein